MSSGVLHPEKEAFQEILLYLLPVDSRVTGVSGVDVVFSYPLGSAQKLHLTEITDALQIRSSMMLWAIISVYKCLCSVCSIQRRQQGHRDQPLPAGHHVRQRCRLPVLGETAGQRMQVCRAVFWILVPLSLKHFFNYSALFLSLYPWVWLCIACMQLFFVSWMHVWVIYHQSEGKN